MDEEVVVTGRSGSRRVHPSEFMESRKVVDAMTLGVWPWEASSAGNRVEV